MDDPTYDVRPGDARDNTGPYREPMPGKLKWALAFVYFQVVSNAAVGLISHFTIADALDHGEQLANPPLAYFAEYFSFIAAVAQLVAAIAVTSGQSWGRNLLIVIEGLGIVIGLITLVTGGTPVGVVGLVLSALVIRTMFQESVRDWLDERSNRLR